MSFLPQTRSSVLAFFVVYVFDWFVVRDSIAGNAGRVEVGMDIDAQVGFKIEASRPDELRDLENRFAPYTYWS